MNTIIGANRRVRSSAEADRLGRLCLELSHLSGGTAGVDGIEALHGETLRVAIAQGMVTRRDGRYHLTEAGRRLARSEG
jgi:hypothetical protein